MPATAESSLSAASLAEMHDRKDLFLALYRELEMADIPKEQAVELAREFAVSVAFAPRMTR